MGRAYILIGGNLGDRERYQSEALAHIEREAGSVRTRSSLYQSAHWGFEHEKDFLNRVVGIDTELSPKQLLERLLRIEDRFGRKRKGERGYKGRILDLDILYFEDLILDETDLKLPHPRIPERRFTLLPLNEIVPELMDPLRGRSVRSMLEACPDPLEVKVFQEGCITST